MSYIVIPIRLRFLCKLCTKSCHSLEDFIEHKREAHFDEFQKTKLIVFEEKTHLNLSPHYHPDSDEQTSTFDSTCTNVQLNKLNLNFQVDPLPDSKLFLNTSHADTDTDAATEGPDGLNVSTYYVFEANNSDLNNAANVIKAEILEVVSLKTEGVEETEPEIRIEPKTELVTYENVNTQNEDHDIDLEDMELIADSDEEEESVSEIDLTHEEMADGTDESFILCDHPSTSASKTFLPVSSANISFDFECQLCSKLCNSKRELSTHSSECVLSHKDSHRYCVPCNRKLCDSKALKGHNLSYHSSSNQAQDGNALRRHFPCQLCSETFQRESHFISHMQIHKIEEGDSDGGKAKFKCSFCSYKTNRPDIFKWHVQTHSEDLLYKCPKPHCGKSFKAKPYLDNHLVTHSGSGWKQFPCPHPNCGKSFKTLRYSKAHVKTIHLAKTRLFKCWELQCEKAFKTRAHLKQHIKQCHKKVKPAKLKE